LVRAQWVGTLKNALYAPKQRGLSLEDGHREVLARDSLPGVKRLACFSLVVLCLSAVWLVPRASWFLSLMAQILKDAYDSRGTSAELAVLVCFKPTFIQIVPITDGKSNIGRRIYERNVLRE
jgi:hypothetical protein